MTARGTLGQVFLSLVGFAVVLLVWQATIVLYDLQRIVLPTPLEVAQTLVKLFGTAGFWKDVGVSLKEFCLGYLIGGALGVVAGGLIGQSPPIRMTVGPVIEGLRFIVPFAWIPLTVLWFGTSLTGKVVLVAYAVFFVMVVTTARSLATVSPTALALKVDLRAAAPSIASGAKAAAAVGWIAVVAAEYIGASAGLGVMITNASMSLLTATVIAGMIVIGVIGAAVSWLVGLATQSWLSY
jgi:ABC-type nitrate/sulfonate/bicarbonate transport system permease component